MGLREDLKSSLKGYDLEFQGKQLHVADQIEYKNNTYLCVILKEKLPEIEYAFLKKIEGATYQNVEDDELCNELYLEVGKNHIISEIEKAKKNIK